MAISKISTKLQNSSDIDNLMALACLAGLDSHERSLVDRMLVSGVQTKGDRLCLQVMCDKHLCGKHLSKSCPDQSVHQSANQSVGHSVVPTRKLLSRSN